jgi:hypothetical protein
VGKAIWKRAERAIIVSQKASFDFAQDRLHRTARLAPSLRKKRRMTTKNKYMSRASLGILLLGSG